MHRLGFGYIVNKRSDMYLDSVILEYRVILKIILVEVKFERDRSLEETYSFNMIILKYIIFLPVLDTKNNYLFQLIFSILLPVNVNNLTKI